MSEEGAACLVCGTSALECQRIYRANKSPAKWCCRACQTRGPRELHREEADSNTLDYEVLRKDERVRRAEQDLREYLDGDIERLFTKEATFLTARMAQARLRVALELRKKEDEEHLDTDGCCECGSHDHVCQDCPTFDGPQETEPMKGGT